jgi:hypothetical protein
MISWQVLPGSTDAVGYGWRDAYLVSGVASADGSEVTAVRLTRWRCADSGFPVLVADAAVVNLITFPMGRGPGRPAGQPEVDALMRTARDYAEKFEGGGDLEGYPAWQHEPEEEGTPAMVFLGPNRKRFACETCGTTVFTRRGEIYTCNGCGEAYQGVTAASAGLEGQRLGFLGVDEVGREAARWVQGPDGCADG